MSLKKQTTKKKSTSIGPRTMVHAQYQGPLPLPAHFGGYEAVLPGSADRILRMAEKEQDKSINTGKMMLSNERLFVMSGQIFSFVLNGGILVTAAYLGLHGNGWTAGILTAIFGSQYVVKLYKGITKNK